MMLGKTASFAESGGHPGSVWSYSARLPAAVVFGFVAGLAIGFVYAVLLELTEDWRRRYESQQAGLGGYFPKAPCGAAAGMIVTVPPFGSRGSLIFAALAGGSAGAMAAMDAGKKRNG